MLEAGRPLVSAGEMTALLLRVLHLGVQATVLICNPHQDHWGLMGKLPTVWPTASATCAAKNDRFFRNT